MTNVDSLKRLVNTYFRFKADLIEGCALQPTTFHGTTISDSDELVIYVVQHVVTGLTTENIIQFINWYKTEKDKAYENIDGWTSECVRITIF